MAPIVLGDEGIERIEALAGSAALEVLETLPADVRDAVRARVVDGRAYPEIAAVEATQRRSKPATRC